MCDELRRAVGEDIETCEEEEAIALLLGRYCHGVLPLEPFAVDLSSELECRCAARIELFTFVIHWMVNYREAVAAVLADSEAVDLTVDMAPVCELDPAFNLSLSMLDRYQGDGHPTPMYGEKELLSYHRLRNSPWQVDHGDIYCPRQSCRSIRAEHVRDEMLAISRIPFTPQLQVKTPREEAQCIVVSIAAR